MHVAATALDQDVGVASSSGRGADLHPPRFLLDGSGDAAPVGDAAAAAIAAAAAAAAVAAATAAAQDADVAPLKAIGRRIRGAGTLPQLLAVVRADCAAFVPGHTTHALGRLAKMHRAVFSSLSSAAARLDSPSARRGAYAEYVRPALALLNARLSTQVEALEAWDVSGALWAYGTLGRGVEGAPLEALCRRGVELMAEFGPADVASVLVGLARLGYVPQGDGRGLLDTLVVHTLHLLQDEPGSWATRELGNVAWAMGRLNLDPGRPLLEALMRVVVWRLDDCTNQEVANVLHGYARMECRLPAALVRIVANLVGRLDTLSAQDVANVMWALARLHFKPHAPFLDLLPYKISGRLAEFKPQEVANLLWGYGSLKHEHPVLLEAVAQASAPRLHQFSTQDLTLTLWAYGMLLKASPPPEALLRAACAELRARLPDLLPLQIAIAVKAFSKMGWQPPPALMADLAAAALARLGQFQPVELCHLLWGFAHLGYRDVALFEGVVAHVQTLLQARRQSIPKQSVDTIVYACTRVGFWPQMLVDVAEMAGVFVRVWAPPGQEADLQLLGAAAGAGGDAWPTAGGDSAPLSAEAAAAAAARAAQSHEQQQQQQQQLELLQQQRHQQRRRLMDPGDSLAASAGAHHHHAQQQHPQQQHPQQQHPLLQHEHQQQRAQAQEQQQAPSAAPPHPQRLHGTTRLQMPHSLQRAEHRRRLRQLWQDEAAAYSRLGGVITRNEQVPAGARDVAAGRAPHLHQQPQ